MSAPLTHGELAELASRSYRGPQSARVALDVRVDLVPRGDELVVVFPGTHPFDPLDWLRDLRAWPMQFAELGYVHSGFGSGAQAVWAREASNLRHNGLLTFTGHSLGGAVALLVGALFAACRINQPFRVVTFGAPRTLFVGNDRVPRVLENRAIPYARAGDVVPDVPLRPLYGHPVRPVGIGWRGPNIVENHAVARYEADLKALDL